MTATVATGLRGAVSRVRQSVVVRRVLPLIVLVVSLGFMARIVAAELPSIQSELRDVRVDLAAAAFVAILVATLGGGVFWRVVLSACGAELSLGSALRAWCLSAPTKYGLGAPTQYAGRVYLAVQAGVPRSTVLVSLAVELVLIVISGLIVLLILAPAGARLLVADALPWMLVLGPPLGIAIAVALPVLVRRLARLLFGGADARVSERAGPQLRLALLVVLLNWALLGVSLFLLALAISPVELSLLPAFVFAATAAILAGMLAFTPLGLGVRDALLIVLLAQLVPLSAATSAALIHRFLSVAAELVCAGGVLALSAARSARRAQTIESGASLAKHEIEPRG